MDARHESGLFGKLLVALHEQLARLVIEGGLWEGHDEQAVDDLEDVRQGVLGLPVLLQRVNAYLARQGHIGVENLRQHVA